VREVERIAAIREKIKITCPFAIGCYEGDVLTVTGEHKTCPKLYVLVNNGRLAASHYDYVVLENN
jgi:hypothetical protein